MAFAYVNAFTAHVNVGFFHGAEPADSSGLLEGMGKYMRHVKITLDVEPDAPALNAMIEAAYADMKRRLGAERTRTGDTAVPATERHTDG